MPDTPTRGSASQVAKMIGRSTTAVYKYMRQTENDPSNPLGREDHGPAGVTLDADKVAVYASSRRPGSPRKNTEAGA